MDLKFYFFYVYIKLIEKGINFKEFQVMAINYKL